MDTEQYSFMQETIKEEAPNPKKISRHILAKTFYGIIFGIAACVGFYLVKPWAETVFLEKQTEVEIPPAEEIVEEEEATEEFELPDMTMEEYQELSKALLGVVSETKRSVVSIEGLYDAESMLENIDSVQCKTSGLVVAEQGGEYLVLANYSSMQDSAGFRVRFMDDSTLNATLKNKDANLDMAIFSFPKQELTEVAKNQLQVAKFGNSGVIQSGTSVFVIGQPFGYAEGVGYGAISSTKEKIRLADGAYGIFTTDIPSCVSGNGFLCDVSGNVIAFANTTLCEELGSEMMVAYKIADIKTQMESLLNGKSLPYMGVHAVDVTDDLIEVHGLPEGIYVKEVEKDSPAMTAGIQSGDIIVSLNKKSVLSLSDLQSILSQLDAGQKVSCEVMRHGNESYVKVDLQVTIGNK